jgi:hypothetical protein
MNAATGPSLWSASILGYLLLCPHVSVTEDIALLSLLVVVDRNGVTTGGYRAGLLLVLAVLILSPVLGPMAGSRPPVGFFVKIALVLWLVAARRRSDGDSISGPRGVPESATGANFGALEPPGRSTAAQAPLPSSTPVPGGGRASGLGMESPVVP